eukprot:TRINITY_DN4318_c0_g1_i1.p1 TRINITY_DN4318_c0_g1~~TRINITY_DN4318_c0_g1_i1.p1  ORF type:complete len:276 (-),score=46.80 TRINITY_DN4318_c0_g1_i1:319-1146(-)
MTVLLTHSRRLLALKGREVRHRACDIMQLGQIAVEPSKLCMLFTSTGFYKGFIATTLGVVPANGAYIFTIEAVRATLPSVPIAAVSSEWTSNFVAGGLASVTSSAISVPLDIVSQRLMVQDGRTHVTQHQYRGVANALATIYRSEGVRGLYRGWGATLVTFGPSSSIWWSTYGALNERMSRAKVLADHPLAVHGLCGVCAGITSAVLTTPLDVAKTRMQVLNLPNVNILQSMQQIVRQEGWRGLCKGMRPRVLNTVPFSLAMIVIYQHVKELSMR